VSCMATLAQGLPAGAIQRNEDEISWTEAPPPFPTGTRMAVLEGNPKQQGIFTARFSLPPDVLIRPHTHPSDERVTVLSGSIFTGFGAKAEKSLAKEIGSGGFYINPAGFVHFIYTGGKGAVIQITAAGPWGIHFPGEKTAGEH
jgi:quercetin dioxygenase-like cupin family protein